MTRQRGELGRFKTSPGGHAQTCRSYRSFLNSDNLNGNTDFWESEFSKLLEESRFVAGVIEIYKNDDSRSFAEITSGTNSPPPHLDHNGHEWQELVRTNLPHWLFWLTYILTAHAKLAAEDRPMSRAELAELLNDRLFRQAGNDLRFKAHRRIIWTPEVLRIAVHNALKDMNTPGAVTLENLARRITFHSRNSSSLNLMTPLSGKHLQKLLKEHDIKWIEIKKSYKERLFKERRLVRALKC